MCVFICVCIFHIVILLLDMENPRNMEDSKKQHRHLFSPTEIFTLFFILSSFEIQKGEALNKKVSAIYVFGDSTVDPGNNNFVKTAFRGNFPPYGINFPHQIPTGRFSNGKLGTDFIGIYTTHTHKHTPTSPLILDNYVF